MNCDLCGEEIGHDATIDTHSVGRSGRFIGNKTYRITMCHRCAASRRATVRWMWCTFALLMGGALIYGIVSRFFTR